MNNSNRKYLARQRGSPNVKVNAKIWFNMDVITLAYAQAEVAPAVAGGNNLNLVVANTPSKAKTANFRAIPTLHLLENKEAEKIGTNGNQNSISIPSKDNQEMKINQFIKSAAKTTQPQKLIWDTCVETMYKENNKYITNKLDHDMEQINKIQSEIVNKRNTKLSDEEATKVFDLPDAVYEERRQPKQDVNILKKTTPIVETLPTESTAVEVVPITKIIINESTTIYDFSDVEVTSGKNKLDQTTQNIVGSTEDWFVFNRRGKPKIRFGGMPQRDIYLVPGLNLDEGFYPFGFMSKFFAVIRPFDFPVGLLKDIIWSQFTFPYSFSHTLLSIFMFENYNVMLIWDVKRMLRLLFFLSISFKSIKVESAFLMFVIVFTCVALIIPVYLLIVVILNLMSKAQGSDDNESGALFPDGKRSKCNGRTLVFVTVLVVLLCCIFISGIAISNEQATSTVLDTPEVFRSGCLDLATWINGAARELHHSLVPSIDVVVQAFRDDLRNIEALLGDPIQKAISSESGIELVLESLQDVVEETEDISAKISSLRDASMKAGAIGKSASDRIKDLARQLENLKMHCGGKDVKLCDTVNSNSLELQMKFDLILQESHLTELRSLGIENLTYALTNIRNRFHKLPSTISTQTSSIRQRIVADIEERRDMIYTSSRVLTDIVRHLNSALHTAVNNFEYHFERFQNYDFWRWGLMLYGAVFFGSVMVLIIFGMLCGCGNTKIHGRRTLILSTIFICMASFTLWTLITIVFLIAGHAEVYVCHILWDHPQYAMLSKLLDRPSPLFDGNEGMFNAIFSELENVTIDVSISDVLRDCEKDYSAYNVFHLDKVVDVNKETSYFEWRDLQNNFESLSKLLDIRFLKTISADLSRILSEMLIVSDVDLAQYRLKYNGPVLGKDLLALADQLQNIAAQVADLTTSTRFETLASRTQRLHLTNIKPLEQFRADIVFKLTELELQLMPFRRKLNISLSHIHTAQFYIDNQADVIAQKKVSAYVNRLISHVADWRTHVLASVSDQAARCGPLFAVFHAARTMLCTRYVASLHGWWVCGALLGMAWCVLTPLLVRLWRSYGRSLKTHDNINLTNMAADTQATPTTLVCESTSWNTPRPPPPRTDDSW